MTSARETLAEIACAVRGSIECPCVVHDDPCKDCFDNAQRIVAALDAAGFAIVPKEPTFEMVKATVGPIKGAVETYKAMLTAAKETT